MYARICTHLLSDSDAALQTPPNGGFLLLLWWVNHLDRSREVGSGVCSETKR
jgi:hypothetical protein